MNIVILTEFSLEFININTIIIHRIHGKIIKYTITEQTQINTYINDTITFSTYAYI